MECRTIRRRDVRDALRHLSRDRTPGSTSLESLRLVGDALRAAGVKSSPRARRYEVGRILASRTERALRDLRARVGVADERRRDPREVLLADFGHGDIEAVMQLVLETFDHSPLFFERMSFSNPERDRTHPNAHVT